MKNKIKGVYKIDKYVFSAFLSLSGLADASEQYPVRPIKIIIGFPAGGSTDAPMRVLADSVSKKLNQPVVIENRLGAGGILPAVAMQSTSNDGYTLAVILPTVFRIPYTTDYKWDPARDLTYIIGLSSYYYGVVVSSNSKIKNWKDYVEAAKLSVDGLSYGTPGIATIQHVTMGKISNNLGMNLNHIPYKGTGETIQALMGGHIESIADSSAWAPFVKDGKMRLLVTWGDKRMESFPDVPTLHEVGIPIAEKSQWGVVGPKGMDPAIVKKLHDAFKQSMREPEFKRVLQNYDMVPEYMDSNSYHKFAVDSIKKEKENAVFLGFDEKGKK